MSRKSTMIKTAVIAPFLAVLLMACAHIAMMANVAKPPASEFGYGPRKSSSGQYQFTLEASSPYKTGKMLSSVVRVKTSAGQSAEGLQLMIDGGMPQHGHGLPTKPRVTQYLGDGRYQIEGLKFNMGGWWELKFAIAGASSDSVVFNLEL